MANETLRKELMTKWMARPDSALYIDFVTWVVGEVASLKEQLKSAESDIEKLDNAYQDAAKRMFDAEAKVAELETALHQRDEWLVHLMKFASRDHRLVRCFPCEEVEKALAGLGEK